MSSGRASDGSGSGVPHIKAISSLARKQSDVTRQGTQKLKFVPTLPVRRKKEEIRSESSTNAPSSALPSISRGGGHGEIRGRGRTKSHAPPGTEMTASGPFAMGPTIAGSSIPRRNTSHSNPAPFLTPNLTSVLGASHSSMLTSSVKNESLQDHKAEGEEDAEVYSDPEQGVEIVDIGNVHQMDFMAPESLPKGGKCKVKKQEPASSIASSEIDQRNPHEFGDISDEEEPENIFEEFFGTGDLGQKVREKGIYSFQFPAPFPTFVQPVDDGGTKIAAGEVQELAATVDTSQRTVDGVIGRLEFYRSGAVKMRLFNGIVLDVTAATKPSFFQQVVYLDKNESRLLALGPVSKRFSASPNIGTLLSAMELANKDNKPLLQSDDNLIQMDVV